MKDKKKNNITTSYTADRPTAVDLLGFDIYVEALVNNIRSLRSHDCPLVVGIYGPWGSGKTSLMQMIEKSLRLDGYEIVWFNAWKYAKEDELWAALIQEILTKLKLAGNLYQRCITHIILWWHSIRWKAGAWDMIRQLVQPLLKAIAIILGLLLFTFPSKGLATIISLLDPSFKNNTDLIQWISRASGLTLTTLGVLTSRVSELFSTKIKFDLDKYRRKNKFQDHVSFLDEFANEFAFLVKIVTRTRSNKPLVVMIDDLDRCLPKQAVSVLEALKLFIGDQTNCIFFIGADREFIEQAIRVHYKDFVGDDILNQSFERDYLEKIVQLPFLLPKPQAGTVTSFIESVAHEKEIKDLAPLLSYGMQANPRRVKRVLRVFNLYREIAIQRKKLTDTYFNLPILAVLTIIQYNWPDVFRSTVTNPRFLGLLQHMFKAENKANSLNELSEELRAKLQTFASNRDLERLLRSEICPSLEGKDLSRYLFIAEISGDVEAQDMPIDSEELLYLIKGTEQSLEVMHGRLSPYYLQGEDGQNLSQAIISVHKRNLMVHEVFIFDDDIKDIVDSHKKAGIPVTEYRPEDSGEKGPWWDTMIIDRSVVVKAESLLSDKSKIAKIEFILISNPRAVKDALGQFGLLLKLYEEYYKSSVQTLDAK